MNINQPIQIVFRPIGDHIEITSRYRRSQQIRRETTQHYVLDILIAENSAHFKGIKLGHGSTVRPIRADAPALAIKFATLTNSCARSATDIRNNSRI